MKPTVLSVAVVVLAVGGSVQAHHSYGAYFRDRNVTIEGEIEHVLFANPHVVLVVRADDANTYTVEWGAQHQLAQRGVTATTLRIGDHVVISGSPARDPNAHRVTLLTEVRRPSDGWEWRRATPLPAQ